MTMASNVKSEKPKSGSAAADNPENKEAEKFLLTPDGVKRQEPGDDGVGFVVPSEKKRLSASDNSSDHSSDTEDSSTMEAEPERVVWDRKIEYILSMMGYCVGLGNVWRFPYVCIRNGGGAFLIPFFVCLFLGGMPLYFMEVSLGQFVSKSALHIWGICPLFRGVGIAMNILCLICSWYYVMILAWTLIYIVHSVRSPQPWTMCDQPWNTEACVPPQGLMPKNETVLAGSLMNMTANGTEYLMGAMNGTVNGTAVNVTVKSSSEEFWTNHVLELSSGLHDLGGIPWHLLVALLVASLIVFGCIMKGVNSVGKVVYVTATLPYILLTVLLIKGSTLTGAEEGIIFYLKPDFSKLFQSSTWIEAALQVFYSLGPAWGNLITMASYNKFRNNCMMDAVMLSVVCEGTSVYAGLGTFAILGHMAYKLGVPIDQFSKTGAGLAFVVYPEAISYLPVPQLWGILFFVMLFTLGLDSQFVTVETMLTTIADTWPRLMKKHEVAFKAIVLSVLCLFSIPLASRGGMYIFQLADWYVAAFTVMLNAIIECIVVAWIYGADRFMSDIRLMIGRKPPCIFRILWKYITPIMLSIVCVFTLLFYKPPKYEDYTYGTGGIMLGWSIALCSFIPIPVYMVYKLLQGEGSFSERLKTACSPTDDWRPSDSSLHEQYKLDNKNKGICHNPLPCFRV